MMSSPKPGHRVRVHYRKDLSANMPLHGKTGVVVTRGTGRPRNHLIEVGGRRYVVPAGNLINAGAPGL
jgi:hypothetical protein